MQLPASEEIILISGAPPIRGHKVRYYQDPELQARILPPPLLRGQAGTATSPGQDQGKELEWAGPGPGGPPAANAPAKTDVADSNAGLRREPELPDHEEVVPDSNKALLEFEPADETPTEVQRRRAVQRRFIDNARQASLDFGDDMGM